MHFKDDPVSDMHAKNYLIISCLKHFPGPTKFGPVFWSRLFRRGPVEYNYPLTCQIFVDWKTRIFQPIKEIVSYIVFLAVIRYL